MNEAKNHEGMLRAFSLVMLSSFVVSCKKESADVISFPAMFPKKATRQAGTLFDETFVILSLPSFVYKLRLEFFEEHHYLIFYACLSSTAACSQSGTFREKVVFSTCFNLEDRVIAHLLKNNNIPVEIFL